MQLTNEARHEEINLYRLVRRLEKSTYTPQDWENHVQSDVWVKTQKDLQKVKYARRLIATVESNDVESSTSDRYSKLNGLKITLDRIEMFLLDQEKRHEQSVPQPESLLARIPIPLDDKEERSREEQLKSPEQPFAQRRRPTPLEPPSEQGDSLFLAPGMEGLQSAIPALMSAEPIESAPAFKPAFIAPNPRSISGSNSTSVSTGIDTSGANARKPYQSQAHAALHEDLSSQLEQMAAQLKRNAMHFAESLEKDKSVVEAAGEKLESNYEVMNKERARLKDFSGKNSSTTWLTIGIVLLVLFIFMLMVSVIRFSRF